KEIAEAAGIAEGTIFRVFATKEDLLDAVITSTFCPAEFRRGLDDIDVTLPLRARLIALVTLLQHRFTDVFDLMGALGLTAPPPSLAGQHDHCSMEHGHVVGDDPGDPERGDAEAPRHHGGGPDDATRTAYLSERFVAADADLLRSSPTEVVNYLRLLTFSGSHRHISGGQLLAPHEIVDVVLSGVQKPPAGSGERDPAQQTCMTTGSATADAVTIAPRTRKAR
ncbi:MAG: helix-turn-helix domain-containing protein, partial [Lapillicoccus sp.]